MVLLSCYIYRWLSRHCKFKLTCRDKEHCKLNHSLTLVFYHNFLTLLAFVTMQKFTKGKDQKVTNWRTVTNNSVSKLLNVNTCYGTLIIWLLSFVKPFIFPTIEKNSGVKKLTKDKVHIVNWLKWTRKMQRLGTNRNLLQQRYKQLRGHTLRCFTFHWKLKKGTYTIAKHLWFELGLVKNTR